MMRPNLCLLAEHTLSREEARQIVEPEVEDWFAAWENRSR